MSNNNPSINPANNGSLAGTLQFVFSKLAQQTDGMLPAKVIKYDRDTNRVQVQILITLITTDGSQIPRPQVASLPVLLIGGGGFFLSFPLKSGDLGWVMASDRDISLFLQSYSQSPPNTNRIKSFSDGVFIPDAMTGYTIDSDDDDKFVIQNLDGTVKISISDTDIDIVALTKVNIDCPLVTVNPSSPGLFAVNGNITASGTITPSVPVPP